MVLRDVLIASRGGSKSRSRSTGSDLVASDSSILYILSDL